MIAETDDIPDASSLSPRLLRYVKPALSPQIQNPNDPSTRSIRSTPMRTTYDNEPIPWNYRADSGLSFDPIISKIGRVRIEIFRCKGPRRFCLGRAEDPGFAAKGGGQVLPTPLHPNISMRTRPILDIIGSNESPESAL